MVIARDEAVQDFREEQTLLDAEPAHDAEIDGNEPAVIVDEQIPRMHVGVKEAIAQRVAEEGLDQRPCQLRQVEALGDKARAIGQRRGVDPFQREDFLGGAVPVHSRHAKIRIVLGVLGHFRERSRFQAEIHFDGDRAPQGIDHFDNAKPPRLGGKIFGVPRDKGEGAKVGMETPLDAGPQHLHGDGPGPVGGLDLGPMHLRNRGGGDRRPEACEARADRPAERGGDHRFRLLLRERRHLVLQMLEIARKRGTDHVGARRQKLTELDVARTEPRERHRQTRPGGVA